MMEIAAALSGIKGALELASAAVDARDSAKAKTAISDVTSRFMDAQIRLVEMTERLLLLQTQLATANQQLEEAKRRLAEREQYVLHEITRGTFAYRFQPSDAAGTQGSVPTHYLCQPCFDKGVKSVLNRIESAYMGLLQICPTCKHEISIDGAG